MRRRMYMRSLKRPKLRKITCYFLAIISKLRGFLDYDVQNTFETPKYPKDRNINGTTTRTSPKPFFFGRKTKIGQKQGFEAIFTLKSLKEIRQKMGFFPGLMWATVWPERMRYCQECFFKLPKVVPCAYNAI